MNNPLLDLLDSIDTETRAATAETVLLAFQILEQRITDELEKARLDPSRSTLLLSYKHILGYYSTYKILWHRWVKKNEYDWAPGHHGRGLRSSEGTIAGSVRKFKAELMQQYAKIKEVFPGITYRELNKESYSVLASKWLQPRHDHEGIIPRCDSRHNPSNIWCSFNSR